MSDMRYEDVREVVRGRVLLAGDAGFEAAAMPWNVTVAQPVAAVVEAMDAADVAALVGYARRAGLAVATQPTGHGASGDVDGVILLRTGRLDDIEIDAERRVARVGAGANWAQVQAATGAHGLTGLPGSSAVVGVTGYVLGGGLSWFGRAHGLASDAVRAFEIVDADGNAARVDPGTDPEMFWALRGGGGDFAIVTALELDLFAAPGLYGGRVLWPGDRTSDVFDAFVALTAAAPDALSLWFQRVEFPDAPPMVGIDAAYLGDPAEGKSLLAALDTLGGAVLDTRGVLPVASVGDICAEPTDPSPVLCRGALLTGVGSTVTDLLIDGPIAPLTVIQIRHLGGAFAEPAAVTGARGPIAEPFVLNLLGLGLPHLTDAVLARQSEILGTLRDHIGATKPLTFLAPGEQAAEAFDETTLARLRELKRVRDPHNVFRSNFPVLG